MTPEEWLTDLPAWKNAPMAKALRDVLDLHQAEEIELRSYDGEAMTLAGTCTHCNVPGNSFAYPCPTRQAITAALSIEEDA